MPRVFWRSWCKLEAAFELERIWKLPMSHQWVNAHQQMPTNADDIWLTTNGYDFVNGRFKKASLYAESYIYLKPQYDAYSRDTRWNHRFHFNPLYAKLPNCSQQGIGCFWLSELSDTYQEIKKNKKIQFTFGMCQGRKAVEKCHTSDFGWYRTEIVKCAKGHSWRYYGVNWISGDPHFGGEIYIKGSRGNPIKFNDARHLMAPAKFVFAAENIHDPNFALNYFTEKIFHGFLSYSVPIYAGCWNVEQLIDPGLFIDLRKFGGDVKQAIDHCEKMPDTEYKGYLDRIEEWLNGKGKDFSCDHRFMQLDQKLKALFG